MSSSIKSLRYVTGGWSLFYREEEDRGLLLPFTARVQIAPSFAEASLPVASLLLLMLAVMTGCALSYLIDRPQH